MHAEQYELNWKNYYNTLELNPTANIQEIKRAYQRLARIHHPDIAKSPILSYRMTEINEAYEVLSHTDRRAKYDEMFQFKYARRISIDESLEAELNEVFSRLAREQNRDSCKKHYAVRTTTLAESLSDLMEYLLIPIPLPFLLSVYLLFYCIILVLIF
jgi:DnaJ-class molecular chaperone